MKKNKDAIIISAFFAIYFGITLFGMGFSLWLMEATYNTFDVYRFYDIGYGAVGALLTCLKWVSVILWTGFSVTVMGLFLKQAQKSLVKKRTEVVV